MFMASRLVKWMRPSLPKAGQWGLVQRTAASPFFGQPASHTPDIPQAYGKPFPHRSVFHGDTQDFWNDFRGFIDNDPITDANILFRNEIFIMKRGTADGAPRKLYGIKDSRRCKDARPAHLDNNIPQRRFRLFGREL